MPEPKRLAFVCSSTSWGGLEMNVLRFSQWLKSDQYSTTLWCVDGSPLAEYATRAGIQPFAIKRHRKYADLGAAVRLAKRLDAARIDIVWIRDTRDMSLMYWVKRFSKRRLMLVYQQAMQLGVSKRDFIHTQRFSAIDLWISPLQFLREQVLTHTRFPAGRIQVIPLAVDLSKFSDLPSRQVARKLLKLPESGVLIGTIGRIDPLKGQLTLIRAFARKKNSDDQLHLLIMGDSTRGEGDQYLHDLHAECTKLNITQHVTFLPHQGNVEIAFAALDIFVMASLGETFGMVTIEALASGCCVIGTNTSGTPELLGNGRHGLLFSPNNDLELAECLEQVLSNPSERILIAERGQAHARATFAIDRVRAELYKVLEEMI
jgi:glycosyltransferase involved in cell wall biosynthesis